MKGVLVLLLVLIDECEDSLGFLLLIGRGSDVGRDMYLSTSGTVDGIDGNGVEDRGG